MALLAISQFSLQFSICAGFPYVVLNEILLIPKMCVIHVLILFNLLSYVFSYYNTPPVRVFTSPFVTLFCLYPESECLNVLFKGRPCEWLR